METENKVEVAKADVEEPIAKRVFGVGYVVEAAKMENWAKGEVVPTPTLPAVSMMKLVCVELPTTKEGPDIPLGFTAKSPHREEEAIEAEVAKVEEAMREKGAVAVSQRGVEVAFTPTPLYRVGVQGKPKFT